MVVMMQRRRKLVFSCITVDDSCVTEDMPHGSNKLFMALFYFLKNRIHVPNTWAYEIMAVIITFASHME